MTVPRINYDAAGFPAPMGLRKACVKMALIEAELSRALPLAKADAEMLAQIRAEVGPMQLSDEEARIAAHVGLWYCGEFERRSAANDDLLKQLKALETRLMEIARLAGDATDGGGE
jgi:hypothetical protein